MEQWLAGSRGNNLRNCKICRPQETGTTEQRVISDDRSWESCPSTSCWDRKIPTGKSDPSTEKGRPSWNLTFLCFNSRPAASSEILFSFSLYLSLILIELTSRYRNSPSRKQETFFKYFLSCYLFQRKEEEEKTARNVRIFLSFASMKLIREERGSAFFSATSWKSRNHAGDVLISFRFLLWNLCLLVCRGLLRFSLLL